jgi:hypothetical protein
MFGKGWSFTEVSDKIKKKARCGGWVADCGVLDGASDLDPLHRHSTQFNLQLTTHNLQSFTRHFSVILILLASCFISIIIINSL